MNKHTIKRIIKYGGGILLLAIISMGIAAFYLSAKWKPVITEKIKEGVYTGSNRLYRINFKDIHLNLWSGNVKLDSITLIPDTQVYRQLKPAYLFELKAAALKISRIGILTAYFSQKIKMNSIVLDQPSINMIYEKAPRKRDKDEKTLYQQIAKTLKSIRIGHISINDANFDYYKGTEKQHEIRHLNMTIKDFLVDSLSQYDTTRIYHAKDIAFELAGYRALTKDKMYTLKIDTIKGSVDRKSIGISGLKLIPMYPDLTFSRKYKAQKDRYDLNFNQVKFNGVDFIKLNNTGNLHARQLIIGPANVAIFLNRELPPPNFDKGRNYPHIALKRLPITTLIDTVSLNKIDIAYTEYNPKTKERGTLKLDNLSGPILNVTNDSVALLKNHKAYANLNTYLMGKGKMNVKIDFNLTDNNGAFSYVGNIGPINLQTLNPLAKALGQLTIESGNVQKMNFKVDANLKAAKGEVNFYYQDLKINLLKEGEDGKAKGKGLLSFLANTVLIKNDNPIKGEALRIANTTFERVPQASFFNLMWKTVFVGVRTAVGIGVVPVKPMPEPKPGSNNQKKEKLKKVN
ncbi:MAG: hypothetical protein V4541_00045 [Bacteroidota bacterium]